MFCHLGIFLITLFLMSDASRKYLLVKLVDDPLEFEGYDIDNVNAVDNGEGKYLEDRDIVPIRPS